MIRTHELVANVHSIGTSQEFNIWGPVEKSTNILSWEKGCQPKRFSSLANVTPPNSFRGFVSHCFMASFLVLLVESHFDLDAGARSFPLFSEMRTATKANVTTTVSSSSLYNLQWKTNIFPVTRWSSPGRARLVLLETSQLLHAPVTTFLGARQGLGPPSGDSRSPNDKKTKRVMEGEGVRQ